MTGQEIQDVYPYLLKVASNSMPPWLKRRVAPEDVVQETYLEAAKGKAGVGTGWLLTVLRHNIVHEIRKINRCGRQRRGKEVHGKALDRHHGTGGESLSEPEYEAILGETIGRLDDDDRDWLARPVSRHRDHQRAKEILSRIS
jgi:DNA-directed RNA polymerase specialized sigma24 family protein